MDQKDIDRLLICREAIDKHREFNKARVEALATSKSVAEAKTYIEEKLSITTAISAGTAKKSTDEIKKILESERTKSTIEMNTELAKYGFADAAEFKKWHDEVVLEIFKECYPISGQCDGCKGLPEPVCMKFFGSNPCVSAKNSAATFNIWIMSMEMVRDKTYLDLGKIWKWKEGCPEGNGFYMEVALQKEPPLDLFWGM